MPDWRRTQIGGYGTLPKAEAVYAFVPGVFLVAYLSPLSGFWNLICNGDLMARHDNMEDLSDHADMLMETPDAD